MKNKTSKLDESANSDLGAVSGSFNDKSKLEYLIEKWEVEADIIKEMTDNVKNGKKPRETYNHFLIQLLKCIGDAKVALKNCH